MEDERNWFVGVDWASETHHVRLSPAGAKDDSRDAEVLADALRTALSHSPSIGDF